MFPLTVFFQQQRKMSNADSNWPVLIKPTICDANQQVFTNVLVAERNGGVNELTQSNSICKTQSATSFLIVNISHGMARGLKPPLPLPIAKSADYTDSKKPVGYKLFGTEWDSHVMAQRSEPYFHFCKLFDSM